MVERYRIDIQKQDNPQWTVGPDLEYENILNQQNWTVAENYAEGLPVQDTVLGFDLGLEHQRIHEYDRVTTEQEERNHNRFIEDAVTYARESHQVSLAPFSPYHVTKDTSGTTTLFNSEWDPETPIREAFNPDSNNPKLKWPDYRKKGVNYERAKAEHRAFCDFEQSSELNDAPDGTIFVWVSPPPIVMLESALPVAEKKKALEEDGYGLFSHTYFFTKRAGMLEPVVIRNKLSSKGHREFLQRLGVDEYTVNSLHDDIDFLNKIHINTNPAFKSAEDAKRIIDHIYAATPENERIVDPQESHEYDWQHITNVVLATKPLLDHLYYVLKHTDRNLISHPHMQQAITNLETQWEIEVTKLIQQKPTVWDQRPHADLSEIERIARAFVRTKMDEIQGVTSFFDEKYDDESARELAETVAYSSRVIHGQSGFAGGHCGKGGGFDSSPAIVGSGATTYSSAMQLFNNTSGEQRISSGERTLRCYCPLCDPDKRKEKVDAIIKNGKIQCPRCEKTSEYKC